MSIVTQGYGAALVVTQGYGEGSTIDPSTILIHPEAVQVGALVEAVQFGQLIEAVQVG